MNNLQCASQNKPTILGLTEHGRQNYHKSTCPYAQTPNYHWACPNSQRDDGAQTRDRHAWTDGQIRHARDGQNTCLREDAYPCLQSSCLVPSSYIAKQTCCSFWPKFRKCTYEEVSCYWNWDRLEGAAKDPVCSRGNGRDHGVLGWGVASCAANNYRE